MCVHRATDVPVGEDQLQHLEFTRDVAKGFNHAYKTKVFPQPQTNLCKASTPSLPIQFTDAQQRPPVA